MFDSHLFPFWCHILFGGLVCYTSFWCARINWLQVKHKEFKWLGIRKLLLWYLFLGIGRSNVGKSSLLNALTRQWGVVRTSDKPGLTQVTLVSWTEVGFLLYMWDNNMHICRLLTSSRLVQKCAWLICRDMVLLMQKKKWKKLGRILWVGD